MVIETYRNKKTDLSPIYETLNSQKDRIELLRELGLQAQLADLTYPRLTQDEASVWEKFLPRIYGGHQIGVKNYSFDEIPLEVLQEWKHAKDLKIFDRIFIRTPEKEIYPDPILLGWIDGGKDFWLIARWGESLLPFNEIRSLVEGKKTRPAITTSDDPITLLAKALPSEMIHRTQIYSRGSLWQTFKAMTATEIR